MNHAQEMAEKCRAAGMSPAQTMYALAKVLHDAVLADYEARAKAAGLVTRRGQSEAERESVCLGQEKLKDDLGLYDVAGQLKAAEKAMVEWSVEVTARRFPDQAEVVDDAYRRAKGNPVAWKKLVERAALLKTGSAVAPDAAG